MQSHYVAVHNTPPSPTDINEASHVLLSSHVYSTCQFDVDLMKEAGTCRNKTSPALLSSITLAFRQRQHQIRQRQRTTALSRHLLKCAWFDIALDHWSSDGCVLLEFGNNDDEEVYCHCSHLTEFILLDYTWRGTTELDHIIDADTVRRFTLL